MSKSNSPLTPAERELLEMLAEEAGEIVQATMKLLRHGKFADDVDDLGKVTIYDNVSDLTSEIDDIVTLIRQLDRHNIVNSHWQDDDVLDDVWERKLPRTHFQIDAPTER